MQFSVKSDFKKCRAAPLVSVNESFLQSLFTNLAEETLICDMDQRASVKTAQALGRGFAVSVGHRCAIWQTAGH